MDYRRTVLPLFLLYYTGAALKITGPSTHRVMLGSDAQIPCKFTADKLPVDPKFFAVIWYYGIQSILSYDNTVMTTNPRYSINKHQALNGIADLIISNTLISDGGVYTCSVTDSPFRMEKEVTLSIQAIPAIAITNKVITKDESTLRSVISGFYPDDIDIKWLRDGKILDKVVVEKPQRDLDGMYSVRSSVTITPTEEDRERIFSCRVQHESLTAPLQEDFQLVYGAIPAIAITNKVITKDESTLRSVISGFYPDDIDIKWLRDGKILDKVIVEKPQKDPDGTYSVRSSVTITPTEEDRERIFSCRVQHESLTTPLQEDFQLVYGAPPRITITGENIIISKENVLSCAISGFYPVDIDIKWLRDGIILNNITLEKPQRDPDGMYSVRSSVTIIPTEEDRERIFSCRIQHKSLTTPLQEDFKLLYGDSTDTKSSTLYIIIPVIAGVVILIITAAVAIFCVKRKGKKNHNKVKNRENQEEKLIPSNQQGQKKHHEDNLENQKENLLANNPPDEDHLPKKPQDREKNVKSVTEKSNNRDKSLINNEPSEAALPSSDHRLTGNIHPSSERQESCSERSGTRQAPVYSAVPPASVHPTSHTGLEPVTAATESNSNITSPQGTKDLRPTIDKQIRDSGRGQAAQQREIDHRLTGNIHPSSERQESFSERSGTQQAPVYSPVLPASVHPTSDTGLEPVTAATESNSHITSPQGTKDLRPTIDMQTGDSGRGQAAQQNKIDHRLTGNIHPSSERQESCSERSGTQQAPAHNAFRPTPVHHTSATGPEPVTAVTRSNSHIASPQGTKDLRQSLDIQTRASGRGQEKQQNKFEHRLTGNIHPSSERQKSYTERSGTQQAPVYNAFRPTPVHHTSATKDLIESLDIQKRDSGRGQEKQQHEIGNQGSCEIS